MKEATEKDHRGKEGESSTEGKLLELYQFEECPYCKRVRVKLTDLGVSYIIHNVPRERGRRDILEKMSGQRFVPVLVDPNTDTMISDDDDKIITYLESTYGQKS